MGNMLFPVPVITSAMIEDLTIIGADIQDRSIAAAKIVLNTLTSDEIGNLAITEAELGALAVTVGKIGALAVTEAKLGALAVTEAKIGALAVTSGKLAADSVITAKILDNAVTLAKCDFELGGGAWEEVAHEVLTSEETEITITGLDINTHKAYKIIVELYSQLGIAQSVAMYVNNDLNDENYYANRCMVEGSSIYGERQNEAYIIYLRPMSCVIAELLLTRSPDGKPRATGILSTGEGALLTNGFFGWKKTATVTNITRLDFVSYTGDGLYNGSNVRILGLT